MRIATYYGNKEVTIEQKPIPKIGDGELLIKNKAVGICGSDVTEWYRAGKIGHVLGHEIGGEIVEVGNGIKQYKIGDRISASHHVPCYQCHYCRLGNHTVCELIKKTNFDPGGFAEYIRLPKQNVHHGVYLLPDHVTYEEATFIEPLACTLRAQEKANTRPEQTVLILGCGIAGSLHILLAKARGVRRIIATDIIDYRIKTAKQLGAHHVFPSSRDLEKQIREVNEGRLADVVITCSANKTVIDQELETVGYGGTILFFALASPDEFLSLPLHQIFWEKGATLMNSYAASPENHLVALDLIQSGKISITALISHRLPFAEVRKGFELVANAQDSMKVIIDITQ